MKKNSRPLSWCFLTRPNRSSLHIGDAMGHFQRQLDMYLSQGIVRLDQSDWYRSDDTCERAIAQLIDANHRGHNFKLSLPSNKYLAISIGD